jgi:hypothetical protein
MVGYRRFGRPCCLHFEGEVSGTTFNPSFLLVQTGLSHFLYSLFYIDVLFQAPLTSLWRWGQQGPPKVWHPTTSLQGVTTQKIATWIDGGAFENRVLRRISGAKRQEVPGWRKLHSEKLHDLYSSPDIIKVMKSRRLRWVGIGEMIDSRRILAAKPASQPSTSTLMKNGPWLGDSGVGTDILDWTRRILCPCWVSAHSSTGLPDAWSDCSRFRPLATQ